jgi:hypothetical protein
VANGVLTNERGQRVRSKYLTHEANVFMKTRLFAIGNCDTSGFLSPVL